MKRRSFGGCLAAVAALAALFALPSAGAASTSEQAASPAAVPEAPTAGTFSALTYNVAGLPEPLSGSEPDINTPFISPLLNDYDLVLVQEDWDNVPPLPEPLVVYHQLLIADVTHPYLSTPAPNPLGTDPRRDTAFVSDGLNRMSRFPFGELVREMWPNCFGGINTGDGGAGDCLSQKGFSVARTEFAPGVEIDVYNLHAEAGSTPLDLQYSAEDFETLADFIGTYSEGRPIIVGGDYNLHTDEAIDGAVFDQFLADTGASDVCEVVDCGADADRIDKFVFRSSSGITIEPLSHRFERDKFVRPGDGAPLSDHSALAVDFAWTLDQTFGDVPTDHPFFGEVAWLANTGIADGYPDGTFRPTTGLTRDAMAAFVHRLGEHQDWRDAADAPECTTAPFPDVPTDHPFCREIAWLVDAGVASGFGDGTFRPGDPVDRKSAAAFLHRLTWDDDDPAPPCTTAPFTDVPASHPFCPAISWLVDLDIAAGYPDGTFRPDLPVSREQVAAFLFRTAQAPQ